MPVFLDEIVQSTRLRVADAKRAGSLRELEMAAERHVPRGFRRSLERFSSAGVAVIAELKKASPSKGVIRPDLDIAAVAKQYEQGGAAALSVLTEERYFQGSLANLLSASSATTLPCLRKDFIVDTFQILEARANRADAILLIVAALSDAELGRFHAEAGELELDVLCEVHDEAELQRAIGLGFDMIGVNSRNLRTFEVDVDIPLKLAEKMPKGVLRVAESGIHKATDIDRLRDAGFDAFLIGESLMRAPEPGEALEALLSECCKRDKRISC